MGNEVSLSLADFRGGPSKVSARLQAGASANKRIRFSEEYGPLPSGCKCTPLGFAVLKRDIALIEVLLAASADPRKLVGLPHPYAFAPLHLAAAIGDARAVKRLLDAGADPNVRLGIKTGTTAPPTLSPSGTTPSLLPFDLMHTRAGDAPLHIAIDCARDATDGAVAVIEALLAHTDINPNQRNARNRTPLYKACKRRLNVVVTLLASHTRVDINAGGPLFAAIQVEDTTLLRQLLDAGADASGGVRYDKGETPLQYAVHRVSPFFNTRAEIVTQLIAAGAVVEPDMISYAAERNWQRVLAALQTGDLRVQEVLNSSPGGSGNHSPSSNRTLSNAGARSQRSSTVSAFANAIHASFARRRSASATATPQQSPSSADSRPPRSDAVTASLQAPAAPGGRCRPTAAVRPGHYGGRGQSITIDSICNAIRIFPRLGIITMPIMLPIMLASALGAALQHVGQALLTMMLVTLALAIFAAPALVYFAYHVLRVTVQLLSYILSDGASGSSSPDSQHRGVAIEQATSHAVSLMSAAEGNAGNQTVSVTVSVRNLLADSIAASGVESSQGQPAFANQNQQLPFANTSSIVNSTGQSASAGRTIEAVLSVHSRLPADGDMADIPTFNPMVYLGGLLWNVYIGFFIALIAVGTAWFAADVLTTLLGSVLRPRLSLGAPLHGVLRDRAARRNRGSRGDDLPPYVRYIFLVALVLRWALGMQYWSLAVLLTGFFVVHEVCDMVASCSRLRQPQGRRVAASRHSPTWSPVVSGAVVTGETDLAVRAAEAAAQPPGSEQDGRVGSDVAANGRTLVGDGDGMSVPAAQSDGGNENGGLRGMCCVCMERPATQGFVHTDVVHCCLCVDCEDEMRQRRQLSSCLICKRTASAVIKVVAT